jgi:hypothetical protein
MIAEIVSPAGASFEIMEPVLLSTSVPSVGNNPNKGFRKLAIHLKNVSNPTITVLFKDAESNSKTTVIPLDKW